jgi:hypothetical protein
MARYQGRQAETRGGLGGLANRLRRQARKSSVPGFLAEPNVPEVEGHSGESARLRTSALLDVSG